MLTHLRFEMSNPTAERDHAIEDHLTLRDRIASLVTGSPVPISTTVASTDPISGADSHLKLPMPNVKP